MDNPPEQLARLTSVPSAAEAAILVAALESEGLDSVATGKMTTNTQLASGEWVEVMVAETDLTVARNTLAKLKAENAAIDWSQVDLGEPE